MSSYKNERFINQNILLMDMSSANFIWELNSVNKKICNFFRKQGIFFSENYGFASYHSVQGDNVVEIPDGISLSNKVWPVDNQTPRDLADALDHCEKIGRRFFMPNEKQDLRVLSRHYMIEGGTLPIKVTYEITTHKNKREQESCTDSLYVKQMNLNRLFLGTLYHMAMLRDYPMAFSECSIVERESRGQTIQEAYQEGDFLKDPKMRRELVKLHVVSYFLGLNDMDNGANTVLDRWQRFDVIDFDKAFWDKVNHPGEGLVNPFVYEINYSNKEREIFPVPDEKLGRPFRKGELDALVRQEMAHVFTNLSKNIELFEGVVDLMSDFSYYNLAAKELYDAEDIFSYFSKRMEEFAEHA